MLFLAVSMTYNVFVTGPWLVDIDFWKAQRTRELYERLGRKD
jgi:hypothetical protein